MSPKAITTTRDALVRMAEVTAEKLTDLARNGYSDSDYDVLENYLTITNQLLSADYEDQLSTLPAKSEAPWCPQEVIDFLPEHAWGEG